MLDALFSFRGRIGRLRFFLSWLGLCAAAVVGGAAAALVVVIPMVLHGAGGPTLGLLLIVPIMLALMGALLWSSLSLQARRFRDIGWPPILVIPGWIVFQIVDQLVARAQLGPAALAGVANFAPHQTIVGSIINLIIGCALLFWPGRRDDDYSETPEPVRARPDKPSPAMPAAPVRSPPPPPRPAAPVWNAPSAPAARTTFGRRGL